MFRKIYNWIKSLFNKPVEPPTLPPAYKFKRIAIIVGHSEKAPGGTAYNGQSEYQFNKPIAAAICTELIKKGFDAIMFLKDGTDSAGIAKRAGDLKCDLSLELHFNSYSSRAYGCELLLVNGQNREPGQTFINLFADKMKFVRRRDQGISWLGRYDRGFNNINQMHKFGVKYAMLLEPAFLDFPTAEAIRLIDNPDQYAKVVSECLIKIIKE